MKIKRLKKENKRKKENENCLSFIDDFRSKRPIFEISFAETLKWEGREKRKRAFLEKRRKKGKRKTKKVGREKMEKGWRKRCEMGREEGGKGEKGRGKELKNT